MYVHRVLDGFTSYLQWIYRVELSLKSLNLKLYQKIVDTKGKISNRMRRMGFKSTIKNLELEPLRLKMGRTLLHFEFLGECLKTLSF